jgi:TRAP-type C4-dicarboxylate transport system substrate-binding protein
VFSLPWIAPHDAELAALTQDAALREALAARLGRAGVVLVALAPLGYREIAAVKPIRAPEDVAGLRLRAIASPLLQDVLRALGARPQTLPFAQAQAALAKGELDGQEGAPSALAAARVVAVGHGHVTDLGGIAEAMAFGVRATVWNAWTPAQRERARRDAAQAVGDVNALAREQAALRDLAAQGASLLRLTAAGQQAFRIAAQSADVRWREVVGRDVVDLAERALASVPASTAVGNANGAAADAAGATAAHPGAGAAPAPSQ